MHFILQRKTKGIFVLVERAAGTGMYRRSLGRPGWAIPNRSGDVVSDKSARIEGARAGAPSSIAYLSGYIETLLLVGERNLILIQHKFGEPYTLSYILFLDKILTSTLSTRDASLRSANIRGSARSTPEHCATSTCPHTKLNPAPTSVLALMAAKVGSLDRVVGR